MNEYNCTLTPLMPSWRGKRKFQFFLNLTLNLGKFKGLTSYAPSSCKTGLASGPDRVSLRPGLVNCGTRSQSDSRRPSLHVTFIAVFFLINLAFYEEYRVSISQGLDVIYAFHYHQMMMRMNNFLYKSEAVQSGDRRPLAGWRLRLWTKPLTIPEMSSRDKCRNED